ncbi:unnamed protein product [Symbiodinium natans]|uniref:EF-hand domain-containing protein n=1 Tax=Symbiodinium natans TaxID=878477 RepID=A0A812IG75_9DINO|nr:unnamed protein product [Symbiodinium natans]
MTPARRTSGDGGSASPKRKVHESKTEYGRDPAKAMDHLRQFLISTTGSVLRAWVEFLDQNNDQKISMTEFSKGMRSLGYMGDVFRLFNILDGDESEELTLDEIDMKQATLWRNFRMFAAASFKSAEELIQKCADWAADITPEMASVHKDRPKAYYLTRDEFCTGIRKCGWNYSVADLNWVYDALEDKGDHLLRASNLGWLATELTRRQKKQEAKIKSKKWQALRIRQEASPQDKHRHFKTFKAFLRKKHGNLIRGWRQALSQTDSMVLSRLHFMKAAARLGFAKESRDLWKSLDKDDSGSASIDELDPRSAEGLAHFKVWVSSQFGGVREAFNAMDSDHTRFITHAEFTAALQRFGFQRPTKQLFSHLDKDGNSKIVIDDVLFLDGWNPLPFLVVPPNFKAMAEIKKLILVRTGQYMKAWRRLLDKDATNRCNWYEFKDACQVLGYTGDIAGAWRAFDDDLSGFISLRQIDEESDMVLSSFRRWCVSEFGSVKSAFAVFDSDCSGSLSFQEFRAACRVYGYDGSARTLFSALDVDQQGTLTLKEISFLDDWEIEAADDELNDARRAGLAATSKVGPGGAGHSSFSVKDHPVRARRVTRRKYELRQRAAPEIPRLRPSRKGDGEYSWSSIALDYWQSKSSSARPWPPDRSVSVSPRMDLDPIGRADISRVDASQEQDFSLSDISSSAFLGSMLADSAVASLVEQVGLPRPPGSPSTPEGLPLPGFPQRPRTQPNPQVTRILSRLDDGAKPSLDDLLSNPRVGPLKSPSPKVPARIGSSFKKSRAYYS